MFCNLMTRLLQFKMLPIEDPNDRTLAELQLIHCDHELLVKVDNR